jgi:glycosidase
MGNVASFYTREYGLDGFRIDAVGGSHIPNWNPAIPYARASLSQSQGGFAMQRAIRSAVRAVRPDGAILAEAGEDVFGATSDAIYDFDLCYNVLHDFRRSPPEVYVPRLRRWLHEQQCAETPDLLRLRHVESHDSLRSGLWYGVDAQRALVALTSWIPGIPLVYHEMEDGSFDVFRKIFRVRHALAELNGGAADY